MTSAPSAEPLVGAHVRLDPLSLDNADGLLPSFGDARAYDQGFVMHACPRTVDEMRELLRSSYLPTRSPGHTPFAVRLVTDTDLGAPGTIVGTTAIHDVSLGNESAHIGSTFYGPRWWGTVVNAEAKRLLLTHLFEDCGFGRVKLQTDALNTRSQAAIERLGAVREGVLRRHKRRADGSFRDTVVFSILADEWPTARAALDHRIERDAASSATGAAPQR